MATNLASPGWSIHKHVALPFGHLWPRPFSNPGMIVKLSRTFVLAGAMVLSAVSAWLPHDGADERWWINV